MSDKTLSDDDLAMLDGCQTALTILWQSRQYAEDSHADLWDFAVELVTLQDAGATISDLRWLVMKELVEHGKETSEYGDRHRSFSNQSDVDFGRTTCFVLTKKGAEFATTHLK